MSADSCPVVIEAAPARRSHVLDAAEGPAEGGLIVEAGQQCNLYQHFFSVRKQLFGVLDPKLD